MIDSNTLLNDLVGNTSHLTKIAKIIAVSELTEEKWLQKPQEGTVEFVIYNLLRVNPQDRWSAQEAAEYFEVLEQKETDIEFSVAPPLHQIAVLASTDESNIVPVLPQPADVALAHIWIIAFAWFMDLISVFTPYAFLSYEEAISR
ncbi:MAG: hypothetical protein JSR93_01095 [Verrucomicrobia bacterium]|nr:hypothetical protein [Verrucomicrobiota bacterium]